MAGTATPQRYVPPAPIMGLESSWYDPVVFDLAQQAGAHWLRKNGLLWAEIEPQEGARNWGAAASLEQELVDASARGFEVILVVRNTPGWAQKTPGVTCGPILPEKLHAFSAFMRDAVARYSAPPYNVRYWEIWNEPDVPVLDQGYENFGCWGEQGDPYYGGGSYAQVLKAVYPEIKQASPLAQVLVGGLLLDCDPVSPPETSAGSGQLKDCTPSRYLEGILIGGGGDYFDGVSFHAYDYYFSGTEKYGNQNWHSAWNTTGPVLIAKTRYLRSVLARYGVPGKPLLNTELGLLCGSDGSEAYCQTDDFQQAKATYLAQAMITGLDQRLLANIWYSLTGWRGTALVDGALKPLPAFNAMSASAELMGEIIVLGEELNAFPGVKQYTFEQQGQPLWALWSLDGLPHEIPLESPLPTIYDIFGALIEIPAQTVTVTPAPIYLDWLP
jgi:hypothetical protein